MNRSTILSIASVAFLIASAAFAYAGATGSGINIPIVSALLVLGLATAVVARRLR